MTDFSAQCPEALTLDPSKRVCYSNGLVLGVDEFVQEELYLLERHRLHNRALHGYGTVCGLEVGERDLGQGPELVVGPGLALDPRGREVRVPRAQCARLNEWLERHPEVGGGSPPASPPDEITLYAVLCYRECKTDEVPVPGGPCRTLEDSTAPSRIEDAFELRLDTEPPEQVEEEAIRRFGELLRSLEVTDTGPFATREELEDLVRALAPAGSPPGPLPPLPAASPPVLAIPPEEATEVLRALFRIWVTEVRPDLLPDGRNCASGPPREECVLLAGIRFPVALAGDDLEVAGPLTIDEEDRPYLLQSRLLQELWLGGGAWAAPGSEVEGAAGGDLAGISPGPTVDGLQARPVSAEAPAQDEVLTWTGSEWAPRPVPTSTPGGPAVEEEGLVRIVALSWEHGGARSSLLFDLDGAPAVGVAVTFGFEAPGDGARVRVEAGSLDVESFQLFAERRIAPAFLDRFRITGEVVPIEPTAFTGGVITAAQRLTVPEAPGAALVLGGTDEGGDVLGRIRDTSTGRLRVVLRGDFIRDTEGRAIDAEHLRGALPTGRRPAGAAVGIQGGRFESWFRIPILLELNRAGVEELAALPILGPVLARRIVDLRTELGRIASMDQLRQVEGIGEVRFRGLRDLVTVNPEE